jgi:membrane protease YdiL (CAAX protease family)
MRVAMQRSWPIYIAVFVGLFVLFVAANYVQAHVLGGGISATEGEELPPVVNVISVALVFAGIHFVAMFAATPGWRRRALYVTRLPWGAGMALVMAAVLFLLPDLVAVFAQGGGEVPETDHAPVDGPAGAPPGAGIDQPTPPDQGPAGEASATENARRLESGSPEQTEATRTDEAATDAADEGSRAESLTTLPAEVVRLVVATAVLVFFLVVARSMGADYWRGLGFSRRRFWRHVGIGAAAYLAFTGAFLPIAQTAVAFVLEQLHLPVQPHEAVEEFRRTTLLSTRVAIVLAITVRAPLFEEIVFRGALFQTMKRYTGAWPAIIATSVVFGLLHPGIFVKVNIFFLALLFGYLFDRTGSIVPGIVLHFLFNSTTALMLILTG